MRMGVRKEMGRDAELVQVPEVPVEVPVPAGPEVEMEGEKAFFPIMSESDEEGRSEEEKETDRPDGGEKVSVSSTDPGTGAPKKQRRRKAKKAKVEVEHLESGSEVEITGGSGVLKADVVQEGALAGEPEVSGIPPRQPEMQPVEVEIEGESSAKVGDNPLMEALMELEAGEGSKRSRENSEGSEPRPKKSTPSLVLSGDPPVEGDMEPLAESIWGSVEHRDEMEDDVLSQASDVSEPVGRKAWNLRRT